MKKIILLCLLQIFIHVSCKHEKSSSESQTTYLNLSFEETTSDTTTPTRWFLGEIGYKVERIAESENPPSYAIKISSNNPKEDEFGMILNYIPIELIKGRSIVFKGRVKTKNVTDGYAGLWCGINQPYGPMSFEGWGENAIDQTCEWTEMSVKAVIGDDVQGFNFGAILNGKGEAWFDSFEIYIDGEKYQDIKTKEPNEKEMAWLSQNVHPIKTCSPDETNDEDLKILDELIGNSKVVALGEVTHGASEIFKMKHRLIKYLAEKQNYDIFSIEADMPNAYRVNDYIIGHKGNAKEYIKNLYFWTWNTEEMLSLIEWMKKYNASGGKIQFTGFDMQLHMGALSTLNDLFSNNKSATHILKQLDKKINASKKIMIQANSFEVEKQTIDEITNLTKELEKQVNESDPNRAWILQNIKVINQCVEDYTDEARDRAMAENITWIKKQNPNSKLIVWGHNFHISKQKPSMGSYLAKELGTDYLTIGFCFNEGSYTSMGDKGLAGYEAEKAYPGTFEYYFAKTKHPICILDLRKLKSENQEVSKWLLQNLKFRTTGGYASSNEFSEMKLCENFDLIIFINKVNPSQLLIKE